MKQKKQKRLLAIGLDATEPTLVRRLIEENELPTLKHLLREGSWSRVESPAHIGSGTVWPTFFTGTEPAAHGIYSDWCWNPETMSLVRYKASSFVPFWRRLAESGVRVGVLDIPFAPLAGFSRGFEITEWGAHDAFDGQMKFAPGAIAELVTRQPGPHPFSYDGHGASGPEDVEGLRKLSAACLEGVKLRGKLAASLIRETETELSIIIFPEIHHAAHQLWHTVVPDHPLCAQSAQQPAHTVSPTLIDILREVDSQIRKLIEAAGGDDTAVMVFSLHGMQAARGLPAFLGPLLCELGLARIADWSALSWAERAHSFLAAVKRRTPAGLKKLYHRNVPQGINHRLAQPTMLPAYDWKRTRAFSLPTDQHGWIRVNLVGRESKGCVNFEDYDKTCHEIEEKVSVLTTQDSRPLVRQVIRTAKTAEEALIQNIPDLVVHWHDAAFELPMNLGSLILEAHTAASGQTGQHAPDGFCILKGLAGCATQAIAGTDLHRIIIKALE
jgi:predicted AlkP superfamily phosphohydrolase/phosphomutase